MSNEREKEGQGKGFTVSDRRKRYEEPAGGAPEAPATPPQAEAPAKQPAARPEAPQPAPAPAPSPAAPAAADAGPGHGEIGPEHGLPGPVDFLQLVGKLYQEGLAFMGLYDDPQTGQSMANFPVASWHIDILGVLEQKTKGNLSEEEAKLLKEAEANLKLTFVRASGHIKH